MAQILQLSLYPDIGLFVLRLAIATIFIYHALPKLKNPAGIGGVFGGGSKGYTMGFALGLVEFLSSFMLITGFYIQIGALLLFLIMLGAIKFKIIKWHIPFSADATTGWEFDFMLLAANIAIFLTGGGNISLF